MMLKTLFTILILCVAGQTLGRDFVLVTLRGPLTFDAQTDRVVVGWVDGRNIEYQAGRLAGMKDVSHPPLDRAIPYGDATVIRLSRFLGDDEADELAENLLVSNSTSWISPLLSLDGESYVASGEIRLRAENGGLSAEEIEQFELRDLRTLADGTTLATRSRSSAWDVLLLCNQLTALTSVEWCEPLWLEGSALNAPAPIDTPRVTIRRVGMDILLSWQWCGDASYEVWSSVAGSEPQWEAATEMTQYADQGVLTRQAYKVYSVRAVPREH